MEQSVKKCTLCGEVKPINHFYKRAMMKDGHRSECKVCNDAKRAERRSKAKQVHVSEEETSNVSKNSFVYNIAVFIISIVIGFAITWSLL